MANNENDESKDLGDFQGIQINYAHAYHDARELMGRKSTDMDDLIYNTGLLYFNAPEKWVYPFQILIQEMEMRQEMMANLPR